MQARRLAFFRMELHAEDAPAGHGGGEGRAVVGPRKHVGGSLGAGVVGVDEVEMVAVDDAQGVLGIGRANGRPAHVRNFQPPGHRHAVEAGFVVHQIVGKTDDASGNQAQSRVFAVFFAGVEEQLHPDADAEERHLAGGGVEDRFDQASALQRIDARAKRTHARYDKPRGACHVFRPVGAANRHAHMREGFFERAQVADAVINES